MKLTLNPTERIVSTRHRHPMGVFFKITPHFLILLVLLVLLGLSFVPYSLDYTWLITISPFVRFLVMVGIIIDWLAMNTVILLEYFLSSIILTNERVVKIKQEGIFSRLIFVADLDRIQDVQVEQRGILAHFYNYGTIRVATASELGELFFKELPDPADFQREVFNAINENDAGNRARALGQMPQGSQG